MTKTLTEKRASNAENQRRYRERQRALGINTNKPYTEEQKEHKRKYVAERRRIAKEQGYILPGDEWAAQNPVRHRENTNNWRNKNPEHALKIYKDTQAKRRSTPWGKINNNMWPLIHSGVASGSFSMGKYNKALGYTWLELRQHIEKQFKEDMHWLNWGDVWELDHIMPVSSYRYESIDCPTFKECWALSNMRPLSKADNAKKGSKIE